jgi:hypothetical protein
MKQKIVFLFGMLFCGTFLNAQQGKYVFYCEADQADVSVNVKGEYQGKKDGYDFYYEKVDALNHKIKGVEISSRTGKFASMTNYMINETLISGSNLKIKEEVSNNKTFYVVSVTPINRNKPLQSKYYSASKGAFDDAISKEYNILVPFSTKAKAEAFIADLRNDIK